MSTSEQDTTVTRRDPLSDEGQLADEGQLTDEQYPVERGHEGAEGADQQRTEGDPNPMFGSDDPLRSAEPRGAGSDDSLRSAEPRGTGSDDVRPSHTEGMGTEVGTTAPASADGTDTGDRTPLVPADRADSFASRWNEVKGMFVDEPRQAVQKADQLVGELLEDLERGFRDQRQQIEHGLDNDDTSTEDLRMALRRYRSFFDRLLSV